MIDLNALRDLTEAAADAVGREIKSLRADYNARLDEIDRRIAERLEFLKDGEPGEPGMPGQRGDKGDQGSPGKLPVVKEWTDQVHYQGDVVTCAGSMFQATRDTGKPPASDDWVCLAVRGQDGTNGTDGRSLQPCGTWSEDAQYHALDVVTYHDGSFVARRDQPGQCPGEGWQQIAQRGKPGKPGERGAKGDRGEGGPAGISVVSAECDLDGLLTMRSLSGS
jgi:hypothetical protein